MIAQKAGVRMPLNDDERADRRVRGNRIALALAAGFFALIWLISQVGPAPADKAVAKLPASAVADCRALLAKGEDLGLIKARPAPNRINVEDAMWAQLPADVKDRTLQAVSCDAWQTAMPADANHVVAYGYRSGKRLQMLTSAGMVRE